jgi:membrane dipeptidase
MIARYEAEFSGRLLRGPADATRWLDEPEDSLCWGVLAIEGLDFLVRGSGDLDRLASLFARGVRVFQLVESGASLLGGTDAPDGDRGLTDLGRATLERLADLAETRSGPRIRPVVDLADLSSRSTSDILSWFEADPSRSERLLLARSHGSIATPARPVAAGLGADNLRRFRALGGVLGLSVGPPFVNTAEDLRDAIEWAATMPLGDHSGYEGIGIGTDFLNLEGAIAPLENVTRVTEWLARDFPPSLAASLAHGSARKLILRLCGTATASKD